jgi:hypothetical protein
MESVGDQVSRKPHFIFPFAQETPPVSEQEASLLYNESTCLVGGLSVRPQRGKPLLFYSLEEGGHMSGAVDPHQPACLLPNSSVSEKWIATLWSRNNLVAIKGVPKLVRSLHERESRQTPFVWMSMSDHLRGSLWFIAR